MHNNGGRLRKKTCLRFDIASYVRGSPGRKPSARALLARSLIVRKGVGRSHDHPPCKAVSLASCYSSNFSLLNTLNPTFKAQPQAQPQARIMGYVRKTIRREHETPKRARFRCLVEQGVSQAEAARRVKVDRSTARKWLSQADRRNPKRTGRPYIIPDKKVEEIIEWMTGHFDRRAMPLP